MLKYLWFLLSLLNTMFAQTTDKYSDEDRPYKFGFNIQGYQHRQEEKDEKGLIKGEYGFITADGYYRVTVYATDENGDFKIISMKNYYVGFPPEDPTTAFPPPSGSGGSPFSKPSSNNQPSTLGGSRENVQSKKAFNRPQGLAACSDCSIPTTTTRPNQIDTRVSGREFGDNGNFGKKPGVQSSQFQQESPRTGDQKSFRGQDPIFPGKSFEKPSLQISQFGGEAPKDIPGSSFQGRGRQSPQLSPENRKSKTQEIPSGFQGSGPTNPGLLSRGLDQPQFNKPGVFANQNFPNERNDFPQNNGLNSSPRKPKIGEVRDGLPPGVSLKDIKDLLYTFNYTVGFHGHHEDGYRNGDKLGDYFFDGRDGVERKVEYLANEFGYQPNITLIDLPNNDVRIPKEESEKEYGLKGYEFKWFYRK